MSQGECPCCHSNNLEYGAVEFYDDQCYFPRVCEDCKATGEERYTMDFSGHYNMFDKDGNEIHLSTNQKENEESRKA